MEKQNQLENVNNEHRLLVKQAVKGLMEIAEEIPIEARCKLLTDVRTALVRGEMIMIETRSSIGRGKSIFYDILRQIG